MEQQALLPPHRQRAQRHHRQVQQDEEQAAQPAHSAKRAKMCVMQPPRTGMRITTATSKRSKPADLLWMPPVSKPVE